MPFPDAKPGQPFVISAEELAANFTVATEAEVKTLRGENEPKPKIPEVTEVGVSVERAREILGTDFLGVEAVEKTFNTKLDAKDIPPIPFGEAEIEKAKELGQFLILRIGSTTEEDLLTMETIESRLKPEYKKQNKGKVLYNTDWYKKEDFYKKDTPFPGWALVSKENIPNSNGKNYLQQTQEIVHYIVDVLFAGTSSLPQEYQEALSEFGQYYTSHFQGKTDVETQALLGSIDWQKYAQELGDLKINQLTRQSPVDALYDLTVYFKNNNRLLQYTKTWTSRRTSDGNLVYVGSFDTHGVDVHRLRPALEYDSLGVSFSRSS